MPKYHVSPVTQKAAICKADKRVCRYVGQQHYTSYNKAYEAQQELNQKMLEDKLVKVDKVAEISSQHTYLKDPNSDHIDDGVDAFCEIDEDEDEYAIRTHITSAEIRSIDMRAVLASAFSVTSDEISPELVQQARNLDFDKSSHWNYKIIGDYYEDTITFIPPEGFKEFVEKEFYAQGNAEDRNGVLSHVRNYGIDTTGLTPVEAVKKYLSHEGETKLPSAIAKKENITKKKVELRKIRLNNNQKFIPAVQRNPRISGILVQNPGGDYTLVGDASQFNVLSDNPRRRTSDFIVIS